VLTNDKTSAEAMSADSELRIGRVEWLSSTSPARYSPLMYVCTLTGEEVGFFGIEHAARRQPRTTQSPATWHDMSHHAQDAVAVWSSIKGVGRINSCVSTYQRLRGTVVERRSGSLGPANFPCPTLDRQLTGDHLCG